MFALDRIAVPVEISPGVAKIRFNREDASAGA
jgi:hypothetical protein